MYLTKKQIDILEDVLNEEALEYIASGYSKEDEYIKEIRGLMKTLNIKERYNFDNFK